jgi:hypothetical protein
MPATLGAPTGGLNGRDSLAEMPHGDAFVLDNWFPNSTSVDTRGGSLTFATGLPSSVDSLEVFTGAGGSKMLAFSGGGIYNVTNAGAVGAALASGKTSSRVTTCMFSNAGSQFLLIYTGADAPMSYDGTTLNTLTITGLTGSQNLLLAGMVFKGRIFLTQAGQLGFYYLAVGAIQGAASYFDLQQQSLKGGYLVAICTYSQESAGQGPQDYAIFVTSEGEYIMYAGSDPSNSAAWSLVGRYFGPPPIGKKSWFRFRSDIYFLTEEGILSFSQIRRMGENAAGNDYLTAKLGRIYTDLTVNQNTHGWGGLIYPRGTGLVVNVPLTGGVTGAYCQFLMNTNTNAWSRYTNWNGISWALLNRRMYFGTAAGTVVLADEGFTDDGTIVPATARQAWNTFEDDHGMGEAEKHFHFASFALQADGVPSISCSINVNFTDEQPQNAPALVPGSGGVWDVATWDVDDWGGAANTQNITVPVGKIGYTASPWVQAVSASAKIRWFATRIILEKTRGVLLQ